MFGEFFGSFSRAKPADVSMDSDSETDREISSPRCENCKACDLRKTASSVSTEKTPTEPTSQLQTKSEATLFVKKVLPDSVVPQKSNQNAAGYDLCSALEYHLAPNLTCIVDTGIAINVPLGCYGRIAPRSGLAAKNKIDVLAGVVDADYCDTVKVILINHSQSPFTINKGDRIAQLVLEKIENAAVLSVVESLPFESDDLARGKAGFGSTGIQSLLTNSENSCVPGDFDSFKQKYSPCNTMLVNSSLVPSLLQLGWIYSNNNTLESSADKTLNQKSIIFPRNRTEELTSIISNMVALETL